SSLARARIEGLRLFGGSLLGRKLLSRRGVRLGRRSLLRRLLRGPGLGGGLLRGGSLDLARDRLPGRLGAMIVIVAAAGAVDVPFLGLDRRLERLAGRRALGDFGGAEQEVDHLVLEQRRAELRLGHCVAADIFGELLALVGAVLLGGL